MACFVENLPAIWEGTVVEPGEMKYGVPNVVYDIIQTVGNLLQGVEKMMEYAGDAEEAGRCRRGHRISHGG